MVDLLSGNVDCAIQGGAVVFHFARGEAANTPFNFFLVALSLFVFWGRRKRAPIKPRHA